MTVKCQQYELYAAEQTSSSEDFTLGQLQAWVDDLRETWWWTTFYSHIQRVEVGAAIRGGRGGSVGWYEADKQAGRIEMASYHRNIPTVVHELAHVIAACYHDSQAHDPWFAREYLNLTYLIRGSEAYLELQRAFIDAKINFFPETDYRPGEQVKT